MKSSKAQIHGKFHKIPVIRFEDQRLTSFSGLLMFQALFAKIKLKRRLKRCFSHLKISPIFGRHLVVLLLIIHLLLGFRRLREIDYYRDDPLVLRLLGLRKLPNVSTISRALSQMQWEEVDKVRDVSCSLVVEGLKREQLPRLTFDFDGSVLTTKAHAEGTAVGYNKRKKGGRSYYPLFCTVAQTGQFFDVLHRPGKEFGDALYIYSFEMMVIGGKLVDAGEMFTFTVLIGRGESISKARRDNSTTKGLQPHRSLSPKL